MYESKRDREPYLLPSWEAYLEQAARDRAAERNPDCGMQRVKRMKNRIASAIVWQGDRLDRNPASHGPYMKGVAGLYAAALQLRLKSDPASREESSDFHPANAGVCRSYDGAVRRFRHLNTLVNQAEDAWKNAQTPRGASEDAANRRRLSRRLLHIETVARIWHAATEAGCREWSREDTQQETQED